MLEIVVAIMIITGMMVLLNNAFSPHLAFKQRQDTDTRMKDLLKATEIMYTANAFSVDNFDQVSSDTAFPTLGQISLWTTERRPVFYRRPVLQSTDGISPIRDQPIHERGQFPVGQSGGVAILCWPWR